MCLKSEVTHGDEETSLSGSDKENPHRAPITEGY